MRKNGFTLIELLAVIVILAIIALIATPIILGIINDAREKANERSVELYASAVRNAIAAYQLTEVNAPKSFSDLTVQYNGDVKCSVQELYEDGSFYLEGCKVNKSEKEYSYGTKQELPFEIGKLSSVCTPAKKQNFQTLPMEPGYEYECKVDPNVEPYTFYVLNRQGTEINLIMDSNINLSGESIKEENPVDRGGIAWISKDDYLKPEIGGTQIEWNTDGPGNTNKGPITVINYLTKATEKWTNLNIQKLNTFSQCDSRNNCTIKQLPQSYNLYARIPYYEEIEDYSENSNNEYLFNYLTAYCIDEETGKSTSCDEATYIQGVHVQGLKHVSNINGYWLLSSDTYEPFYAWSLCSDHSMKVADYVNGNGVYTSNGFGVRPVITLEI